MMDFVLADRSVLELPVGREPSQGEMMPNFLGVFEDEGLAFRLITLFGVPGAFAEAVGLKTPHYAIRELADYAIFKRMNSTDRSETRFHVDPKAVL
jgi:hypothetical protein